MINPAFMYEFLWFFIIYAFLGWCVEVIYATIVTRKFINRGFLNGPLCPIYGFGVISLILFLNSYKDQVLKLFLYSTILVSAIEYLAGFLLEKLFHHRWWDYSDKKFNLNGYISLRFSIFWGIGCVLIIKYIHPMVEKLVENIPTVIAYPIIFILIVFLLVDTYITVISINGLNIRLRQLEEITFKIKSLSNELGETIYERTNNVLDKNDKLKIRLERKREDLEELLIKQREIIRQKRVIHKRLLSAFPRMKSKKFGNALEKLRNQDK